jgi:hypothetical protein
MSGLWKKEMLAFGGLSFYIVRMIVVAISSNRSQTSLAIQPNPHHHILDIAVGVEARVPTPAELLKRRNDRVTQEMIDGICEDLVEANIAYTNNSALANLFRSRGYVVAHLMAGTWSVEFPL